MDKIVRTFHAAADISSSQFHAVMGSGEFGIAPITNGNAQVPIGILENDPDADGQPASVCVFGVTRARCGGSVSAWNRLSVNNTGELIAAPYEAAIGTADLYVIATALEDGADNEIIEVFVHGIVGVPGSTE